jgi:GxxExxY protein
MNRGYQNDIYLQNLYSGHVVNAAMKVHTELGPKLLESTYEICLKQELRKRGLMVESQVVLPVCYDGTRIDAGYRIDMLVENTLIVELKAVGSIQDIFRAQILTYLKLSGLRIGLLINFNTFSLKDGIQRFINGY